MEAADEEQRRCDVPCCPLYQYARVSHADPSGGAGCTRRWSKRRPRRAQYAARDVAAMSTIHVVAEGEHLAGIAAAFGFSSILAIWHHAENAELKALRKNPNVLFAGDRVFIPDRELRIEDAATGQKHVFAAARTELKLRIKVLDSLDAPRPPPCTLIGDDFRSEMSDKGEGILAGSVPETARKAQLHFPNFDKDEPELRVPLSLGDLDPITEPAGQRQRLNNLGYFAGFDPRSSAQLKFAIEEFQCDHLKEIGKKKGDGIFDDATRRVLEQVYGGN
jgi:hypothetical protein